MDELKFLTDKGWMGIGAWVFIKEIIPLYKKYVSGSYVSYKDLDKKLSDLIIKVEKHLEKEAEEDIRMAKHETELQFLKEEQDEAKGDIKDIFRLLSEIKNLMIEKGR